MTKKTVEDEAPKNGFEVTSNDKVAVASTATAKTDVIEVNGFTVTTFVGVQGR